MGANWVLWLDPGLATQSYGVAMEPSKGPLARAKDLQRVTDEGDQKKQASSGADSALKLTDLMKEMSLSRDQTLAKIDSVAIEVGLLRVDLRKVSERVTEVKALISELQQ
ncbi:hypothetical protein NDU88_004664 [Pleurodeles waltl]|uniref:Uncharacterized protein n=1 Tax=Pleurodeles waltl TaxID=8319 RepID=A0AAV7M8U5_PLEWA|nr:hypothetical protein NDU88_004664 [Pleurodeles waltl]